MRKISYLICFCLVSLVYSNSQAQKTTANINDLGVAIQGYDPVSYFDADKPMKGLPELAYTYQGSTYYFIDGKNKKTFVSQPKKYVPKYGGWCAYAMGVDGSKVKIDPETFKIIAGELYLFYNFFPVNTLKKWNDDEVALKKEADLQWNRTVESKN